MIDNRKALVTAVVTTHNRVNLVEKAIDSVLNQTYSNIELFVVDDASNDGTKDVLSQRAKHEGFTYIYIPPEESKGGNYARNLGIRNAHGQYIAFLDDDDEWLPTKTEKQVEFLEINTDYGVVSCLLIYEFDLKERKNQVDRNLMEGDIHELVFTKIPFVTSTLMINKKYLESSGIFDENLRFWQEYELGIRLAQVSMIGFVHENLCLYRILHNDKNRLTNKLAGWMDAVNYIDAKHKKLINQLPREDYKKRQLLIANEGLIRAKTVGDSKQEKLFLLMKYKYAPSVNNHVKYVLTKYILGIKGLRAVKRIKKRVGKLLYK